LKKLKAATASALTYMEVVSTITLGVLVLSETLSWTMIVGGLMIIGSSFLLGQEK
jgi:drug/metabolite transporter (DMT)-like permease